MGHNPQPPGFHFHPSDEELVVHYLEKKVYGCSLDRNIISEADPYEYEPWDLPGKSCVQGRDSELYFFSPKNGRHSKGNQLDSIGGYWRPTGRKKTILARAIKKTKKFYRRHDKQREKTSWQMHEYVLKHNDSSPVQNSVVLCKVFQKAIRKRDEVPCTETRPLSSLGLESDMLTTQPTNVFDPNFDHNICQGKTLAEDTCKLPGDSDMLTTQPTNVFDPNFDHNICQGKTLAEDTCKLPGDMLLSDDELQMILMNHLCDPDDRKPNIEENELGEVSGYKNQPLKLEKGTSSVNGTYCMEDGIGNQHSQETMIDRSMRLSSFLSDQQDFPQEIQGGDFIELNDLSTPLDRDSSSSDVTL